MESCQYSAALGCRCKVPAASAAAARANLPTMHWESNDGASKDVSRIRC